MNFFIKKTVRLMNLPIITSFLFIMALGFANPACASENKDSSTIVEVNGKKLTETDLNSQLDKVLTSTKGQFPPDQIETVKEEIKKNIIENFIQRTILEDEIQKSKITADKTEVDNELDEIKKSLPAGMTLEFALQQTGRSMDEMTDDIAFMVKVNKLLDLKMKDTPEPTAAEIEEFYNENKDQFIQEETVSARHILIKVEEDDDKKTKDEKFAKAKSVREKLINGEDFEKLALDSSDCPSKENGGSLGDFTRGRMVKPFEEAAFSQEINEIGPVVETKFGYHIIQVLDREEEKSQTLAEATPEIKKILRNQQKEKFAQSYIQDLRSKAKIIK